MLPELTIKMEHTAKICLFILAKAEKVYTWLFNKQFRLNNKDNLKFKA